MTRPAALLLVVSLSSCGEPPKSPPSGTLPSERPNLVVVVVDDLRWDEFCAGGHPYLETRNIDRLATSLADRYHPADPA